MKSHDRIWALTHSPKIAWDLLLLGRYDLTYDQMPLRFQQMSLTKRWNLVKASSNLLHRNVSPWNLPLHLHVELTNYCNLRCPVCPAGVRAITRPPRAIDVDLFEQLMAELGPTLLTVSLWGWGEPLLHPRLREILRIVRQYPVATFLSTSSQKLSDDEILDALIEYPPTHLIVAIDGLDDETHSRFRIGATLKPILAGVHRLAERKRTLRRRDPVLHMRYIVMKHNQHEFASVKDFAAAHGFDFLTIRTLSLVDALEDVHDRFVPDAHEFRAYDYSNGERLHQQDFICTQPFWFPSVYADGTVVACEQDYNAQHPIGIFSKETSFAQLWSSPNARRVRRVIRDTPYVLRFCRSCPFSDRVTKPCSILRFILNPALPDRIPVAQ